MPVRLPKLGSISRGVPHGRRAMSLFELMLVLVLLVVVGSLSTPLLEGSFSTIRLRRGCDHVLAAYTQARTHAIETGRVFQFRFEPTGSKYRVEVWSGGLETSTTTVAEDPITAPAVSDSMPTPDGQSELVSWTLEEALPEQITFGAAESMQPNQQQPTRLDRMTVDAWSAPILFFPDGTTSAASLLLKNEKDVYQRVTLRSLTGVGRASGLLTREEITRLQNR